MNKAKEIDFTMIEQGKAIARDSIAHIVKHDRRSLFVLSNIVLYHTLLTLLILRLFGLV